MRRRCVCAEKQAGDQTATATTAIVTREVSAASIKSAKPPEISVTRNIAVTAENAAGALPEIGNDYDIGLVIAGGGFDPCLPLTHLVGGAQVCVSVGGSNLQAAVFVNQEEVDHA